ncbi:MAG TPA: hypothetical protein VH394_22800 [Thermoanaerobaculia bacterium]|jgi:hypothetical protein|nr:hypothetical protein [Thermoanaerobaculia bacterium]
MDADFLVLKVQDHVGSLGELEDRESLPLGGRDEVRQALENALPSIDWHGNSGLWWSGEVFSIEAVLPEGPDPLRSFTLKVRLNPALSAGPWLRSDEAELEAFLVAVCDPNGWSLFELGSGRIYEFTDEIEESSSGFPLRTAGLVN